MISTSLLETSRESTSLIDLAHAHGIRVWWRELPARDAAWSARHRSIWVRPNMTEVETRSLLAHELGHAYYGDAGPQLWINEDRAWRHAAQLLVSPAAYEAAEILVGPHKGALAETLCVTLEVIDACQGLLRARQW